MKFPHFISRPFIFIAVSCAVNTAAAQDEVIKDTGAVVSKAGAVFGAYADAYYAYDFNRPADKNIPFAYNYSRHNEFNINLAMLSARFSSEKIRGAVSLQTGTYPQFNYAGEPAILQHIYEAYAGFRPTKNTWLDGGIFPSHIGFESALANVNWTLTRSLAAENTPYFETGLRFTHELSDKWTYCLLLLNGWQNIRQLNEGKAIGTELQYKPREEVLFNWSTYIGSNLPDTNNKQRVFNDLYATIKLSSKWKFAALFDIGLQKENAGSATYPWYDGSLILRYEFTDHTALAARVEYYNDRTGIIIPASTPNGFQTSGASLNFDYKPAKNFMWRVEAKHYLSNDKIYTQDHTPVNTNTILTSSMIISF